MASNAINIIAAATPRCSGRTLGAKWAQYALQLWNREFERELA